MQIPVMLAKRFQESGSEIQYPACVQPKINGVRCIARISNGRCELLSRNLKPFSSLPHIVQALESAFPSGEYRLDGELFTPEVAFDDLVGLVRSKSAQSGSEKIQYFVFDQVTPGPFEQRYRELTESCWSSPLQLVPTYTVSNENEVETHLHTFAKQNFCGVMVRNSASPYEGVRSRNLQKYKLFFDAEFRIVDIEETHFVCRSSMGKFRAESAISAEKMREYISRKDELTGELLTVKYMGLSESCLPVSPIAIAIRQDT